MTALAEVICSSASWKLCSRDLTAWPSGRSILGSSNATSGHQHWNFRDDQWRPTDPSVRRSFAQCLLADSPTWAKRPPKTCENGKKFCYSLIQIREVRHVASKIQYNCASLHYVAIPRLCSGTGDWQCGLGATKCCGKQVLEVWHVCKFVKFKQLATESFL